MELVDTFLDSELNWYLMRSTGIVAWVLLTASVFAGLALRTKLFGTRLPPPWMLDLHRGVSGLSVVFTLVHVVSVVADRFVDFTWLQVLVPFTHAFSPLAIAAGILAMHLLLAIQVTSLMQQRVGRKLWRRVHMTALPAWLMATGHLVGAGTDATNVLLGTAVLAGVGLLALPLTVRALQPRRRRGGGARVVRARAASAATSRPTETPAQEAMAVEVDA